MLYTPLAQWKIGNIITNWDEVDPMLHRVPLVQWDSLSQNLLGRVSQPPEEGFEGARWGEEQKGEFCRASGSLDVFCKTKPLRQHLFEATRRHKLTMCYVKKYFMAPALNLLAIHFILVGGQFYQ